MTMFEYSFKRTYPDERAVTATEWKRAHGAIGPLHDERCWDLPQGVGIPAAPALLCWHAAHATPNEPEYLARIYRLEGKTLRQAWEGIVATDSNWLDLTPIVAANGASLVVHDANRGACEGALAQADEKVYAGIEVPWQGVMVRGCLQRGKWEYRSDKFVQVEQVALANTKPLGSASASVSAPAADPTVQTRAPTAAPPEETFSFKTSYLSERAVTATEWKRVHGALGPLRDSQCWDLPQGVGVPAAPALLCWHSASDALPRPEYVARVYRLEGKKLRQVWQGTVATWTNWLDLTPIVADDGASLVVHDRSLGSCERAFAEAHAKLNARIDTPWLSVINRGCQQRGKWEYRAGKFVQVEKVSLPDLFW